jgi:hypothetical protein
MTWLAIVLGVIGGLMVFAGMVCARPGFGRGVLVGVGGGVMAYVVIYLLIPW